MRYRRRLGIGSLFLLLAASLSFPACRRRAGAPRLPVPLRGDSVWFTDGLGESDAAVEETLAQFRCAAVYLPARRLSVRSGAWSSIDLPAPARPLARIPVVLVIDSPNDPLAGLPEEQARQFGGFLGNEIVAALARRAAFGPVRGVHLDLPFSGPTAQAHGAALREARSRLSHRLARAGDDESRHASGMTITYSIRRAPPAAEEELQAVRALASRTDGLIAFGFGGNNAADPADTDSLGKFWWAGYEPSGSGSIRKASGEAGPRVPEGAIDPLTDDPRTEFLHELPWNVEKGSGFTLRARRTLAVPGLRLAAGDAVVFLQPSLAEMVARLRSDVSGRRFARGRVIVFSGRSDAERLFPAAALAEVLAGRAAAPQWRAWADTEGRRLVRIGAENGSPHASVVSREQNWIEVDLSPARVGDVETGGFERWEAYDAKGRAVSPGRATRVRLYETLLAPLEKLEPARLRIRGALPSPCCRIRSHVRGAAPEEVATDWAP